MLHGKSLTVGVLLTALTLTSGLLANDSTKVEQRVVPELRATRINPEKSMVI